MIRRPAQTREFRVVLQPVSRSGPGCTCGHGGGELRSVRADIFLLDAALLIDDEGHYSGVVPFVGIGNERVPGDHVAIDDVAVSSPGCMSALASEDLEVVAGIRRAIEFEGRPESSHPM